MCARCLLRQRRARVQEEPPLLPWPPQEAGMKPDVQPTTWHLVIGLFRSLCVSSPFHWPATCFTPDQVLGVDNKAISFETLGEEDQRGSGTGKDLGGGRVHGKRSLGGPGLSCVCAVHDVNQLVNQQRGGRRKQGSRVLGRGEVDLGALFEQELHHMAVAPFARTRKGMLSPTPLVPYKRDGAAVMLSLAMTSGRHVSCLSSNTWFETHVLSEQLSK